MCWGGEWPIGPGGARAAVAPPPLSAMPAAAATAAGAGECTTAAARAVAASNKNQSSSSSNNKWCRRYEGRLQRRAATLVVAFAWFCFSLFDEKTRKLRYGAMQGKFGENNKPNLVCDFQVRRLPS